MKRTYIIICLVCAAVSFTACKKYLQVQPEGVYTEDQVFANEHSIQEALNGLYLNLADNNLYGAALTTVNIELMGQRYNAPSVNISYNAYPLFAAYQYNQQPVRDQFEGVWTKAYGTILSANVFLAKMDGALQKNVVSAAKGNLLKGEAIAIRAMLHFDLLRLFGPVYAAAADKPAIPYITVADGTSQPILAANQVMDSVLADFNRAATLLAADPVINSGVSNSTDFYSGSRNQRLNYFAVKGLMARAYLWAGRKQEAHDAAQGVLQQGEKWFPWLQYSAIVSNPNPDRIFSPEVLLSVYNTNMYTNYTTYFAPEILDIHILAAQPNRLAEVFENNENDYRYTSTWLTGPKAYRTFYKFADLADKTKPWRNLQPLLRKTELYYILAETEPDFAKGKQYMDTVLNHRGLPPLASTIVNLAPEILKEYKKEFWGEGQLFFCYKRLNQATVPSGSSRTANVRPSYVVPLPLSETTPR